MVRRTEKLANLVEHRAAAGNRPPHPALWQVPVAGSDLRLFVESGPLLAAILDDLRTATRRIWLESYIFAADAGGRLVAEVLKQKAREGVDVRVMYDAFGSRSTPTAFFDEMARAGVRVHGFHKATYALRQLAFFSIFNSRNHRKLLVIDDRVAYFGGMNFVNPYLPPQIEAQELPSPPAASSSESWRDVHVRLCGPEQAPIARGMDALWRRVHHEKSRRPRWARRKMLTSRHEAIYCFDCEPGLKLRRARRILCPLLRRARKTITISMAYFIPGGPVLRELLRARKRGVRVRIVLPANSDVPPTRWACRHNYPRLVKHGFHIYERQDLMLHSKVLVIDDELSLIGSCNLDPRSLRSNLEFLAVVRSSPLARALKQICAFELKHSRRVRAIDCCGLTRWQRFLDWLAWCCRRWL